MNAWSCVFLGHWIEQLSNWIVGTCIVFVCCGCGGGFSDVALGWMSSCSLYSDVALPLWVRICFIRLDHWIVEYSHHLHCFGFCKECVWMWSLRSCACEDAWSHCVQLCGFCPLWMSMCLFRLPAYCFGFCKECVLMWYLRSCACEDAKSHCVQLCGFCHCEWACASSDYQLGQRTLCIVNSCVLSPHCGWSCASSRSLALDTSVCSFFAVC